MSTQRSILLVGEAGAEREAALQVLKAASGGREILVLADRTAALRVVTTEKVDCVFSYSRSTPEDSVDFLTEVWHRAPAAGRFVIAPKIDAETQLRCAFGAHHFLSAPLSEKAVEAALTFAQGKEAILANEQVQILIARMRSLPSKPTIYFEVMRALDSTHGDATQIAELIQTDPGIASKVIQVVNSIFYGRAQAVHDMKEAVLFLGFEVTASIVLSLEAISRFEKIPALHDFADQVWSHSQELAELSRKICLIFGQERDPCDQAYVAGLLHDIGKLALAQNFPKEYRQILRKAQAENRPLIEVEKEALHVTHADAGAYLLAVWGLPVGMFKAVAQHHSPSTGIQGELSAAVAVHLAEQILESGKAVQEIIAEYPAELGLAEHAETICALAPTSQKPGITTVLGSNGHSKVQLTVHA